MISSNNAVVTLEQKQRDAAAKIRRGQKEERKLKIKREAELKHQQAEERALELERARRHERSREQEEKRRRMEEFQSVKLANEAEMVSCARLNAHSIYSATQASPET